MKKGILILGIFFIFSTAFMAGVFGKKDRARQLVVSRITDGTQTQEIHEGSALLTGRIISIKSNGTRNSLTLQFAEIVNGHDAAGQAALEAGACTLEMLEKYECTPNSFFIRETQQQLEIPLARNAHIQVRTPGPNGEVALDDNSVPKLRDIQLKDFQKMLEYNDFSKHALFMLTTEAENIVKIQEQYLP